MFTKFIGEKSYGYLNGSLSLGFMSNTFANPFYPTFFAASQFGQLNLPQHRCFS
jgi:hypothetical protein